MNKIPEPAKISKADKFKADVVFLIIGLFVLYSFVKLFEFIFSPLKKLTQKEISDEVETRIRQKRDNRRNKRKKRFHPEDPMRQFYLRFVDKPKEYEDDIDNDLYEGWFNAWKKGQVIDSDLRWAPDIFEGLFDNDTIRSNFIDYMKIQLALHKRASFLNKMMFTNTIFRFYPEFSASLRGLEEDLAHYEMENDEEGTENELLAEIESFGLPTELAEYLVEKDINASTLRKEALILKKHSENGYCTETCICALENKIDTDVALQVIEKGVTEGNLPARAVMARINEEITDEQLCNLMQHMIELHNSWGSDLYETAPGSTSSNYDEMVDVKLNEYKGKNVLRRMEDKK